MNYKSFISILLLTLVMSCTTQHDEVTSLVKGVKIRAYTSDTRTTFDGERSMWSEGDQLQVAIGTADNNLQIAEFSLQDAQDGEFENEELSLRQNILYNAYALYSVQGVSPTTSTKSATIIIGASSQTQNGTSTSHIAPLDPLFGKAEGVRANAIGMLMYHSAVVLRLNIKNQTSGTISGIRSVKVVAPAEVSLSGERTIDFTAEPHEAISGEGGSNTLTINVNSSGSISNGSTFTVWGAAAPFVMEAGSTLKFVVTTTDDKVLEYSKSFAEVMAFEAGSIMQTTITPTPQAEQIVLNWGCLGDNTYPAGMPTCTLDDLNDKSSDSAVNKNGICSGTYPISHWQIRIDGDVKHAYVSKLKCIRFRDITNEQTAKIYFPAIDGYRLTKVVANIRTAKSNDLRVGIRPEIASLNDKTTQNESTTYKLTTSSVGEQYSLYIYSTDSGKLSYDLTSIELTYSLE